MFSVITERVRPLLATDAAEQLYCKILERDATTSAALLASRLGFPECGAVVTFEGLVRRTEHEQKLHAINYEFHPRMAEPELKRLCASALQLFEIEQIACEHRTGVVGVQEVSVALAVGASHRAAAFAACQYVLDRLKQVVPIWKTPIYNADEPAT